METKSNSDKIIEALYAEFDKESEARNLNDDIIMFATISVYGGDTYHVELKLASNELCYVFNEFNIHGVYSIPSVIETVIEQFISAYPEMAFKKPEDSKCDMVNHPSHYTQGGIECIDAIQASMSIEGFRDYCKGNILKYVWRYWDKNGVEDLKKALWYLNKLISTFEEEDSDD